MAVELAQDTISAVATAAGEAAVGIVRLSGPGAKDIGRRLFRTKAGKCVTLSDRGMAYGTVLDFASGEAIDECIMLWMSAPRSYTGEDTVEFQIHGGIQVLQGVLASTVAGGARLADPGEFTKRAFLNGRMDLSQAEAVMDLIQSKTQRAAQSALVQVQGRLRDRVVEFRRALIQLQAQVEVTIDYPEHDVEDVAALAVAEVADSLVSGIDGLLKFVRFGRILRDGVATAILGRPNVGKSSLLNALSGRDRAIVTDIPGTTRDVLEEYVNLRGIPFRLMDTAGIREADDVVERMGVLRSREALDKADIVLMMADGSQPIHGDDRSLLESSQFAQRIVVINKSDLPQDPSWKIVTDIAANSPVIYMSVRDGVGLAELEREMERMVVKGGVDRSEAAYMLNERQSTLLSQAREELLEASEAAKSGVTLDVVAVGLQAAYAHLGKVIGEEVGDDLLNEIFSRFCLGK